MIPGLRVSEWRTLRSTDQTKPCVYGSNFLILLGYAKIHFQKLLLSPKERVMINVNNFPQIYQYLDVIIGYNCVSNQHKWQNVPCSCAIIQCDDDSISGDRTQNKHIDLGDLSCSRPLPFPILVNVYLACVVNCSVCFLCCFLSSCVNLDTSFNIYPHNNSEKRIFSCLLYRYRT